MKYRDDLPWAAQKRLNRSRCCLGFELGWAGGSIYYVGCTLALPSEYHWTIHVRRWRGLLSNCFDHSFDICYRWRCWYGCWGWFWCRVDWRQYKEGNSLYVFVQMWLQIIAIIYVVRLVYHFCIYYPSYSFYHFHLIHSPLRVTGFLCVILCYFVSFTCLVFTICYFVVSVYSGFITSGFHKFFILCRLTVEHVWWTPYLCHMSYMLQWLFSVITTFHSIISAFINFLFPSVSYASNSVSDST